VVFANDHFLSLSLSIILGGLFVVVVFFIHIIKLVKSMTWILNFFSFLGKLGLLKHFFYSSRKKIDSTLGVTHSTYLVRNFTHGGINTIDPKHRACAHISLWT